MWFIAHRLFKQSDAKRRVSGTAISIATAGVALGIAVMLISIAVLQGFQREVRGKVTGFGAHMQMLDTRSLTTQLAYPIEVDKTAMARIRETKGVKHAQRVCAIAGMLKTEETFRGVQIRGVGPDYDLTFLRQHLVEGEIPTFSDEESSNNIVISRETAKYLNLKVGDRAYAYFFDNSIRARRFTVAGIYCTNMVDFDRLCVFTDYAMVHRIQRYEGSLPWTEDQCSAVEIMADDYDHLEEVHQRVLDRFFNVNSPEALPYPILSVREIYPQVFSWLELLDMDVWVILILMTCVAGVTMVSGLLIIILERTNFIGVMKAIGATNGQLQRLFLIYAAQIVLRGLVLGNVIAFAALFAQQHFSIFRLEPETYYMDTVPVYFHVPFIVAVNVATFVVSFLAMIVPSYLVSKIHPAQSIRFE